MNGRLDCEQHSHGSSQRHIDYLIAKRSHRSSEPHASFFTHFSRRTSIQKHSLKKVSVRFEPHRHTLLLPLIPSTLSAKVSATHFPLATSFMRTYHLGTELLFESALCRRRTMALTLSLSFPARVSLSSAPGSLLNTVSVGRV